MSQPRSQGDPRVLFVMNLLLSFLFCYTVVWGLDFLGEVTLTLRLVGTATVAMMMVNYLIVLR
jgi:hypothetical protein